MRVILALRRGEPSVSLKYVILDEAEERFCLSVFDPIAALATTDNAQFDSLLQDVTIGRTAVQELLAQQAD